MLTALEGLVRELREIGVPISMTEQIDAANALELVDLLDREAVRAVLRTTLVKDAGHLGSFDVVFDLFFGLRTLMVDPGAESEGSLSALDDAELRDLLAGAMTRDDRGLRRLVVRELVERHAAFEPGRRVAGTLYHLRTMRAIDVENLALPLDADLSGGATAELDRRLAVERRQGVIEALEREVEGEIRRRLVADRGAEAVARTLREPLPEDLDFLQATSRDIRAMREVVEPLARKLAARMEARRRHRSRGALDFRRTIRESMSTGGVLAQPVFRPRRPTKPRLVVLADISGSVAAFAAFTLSLAFALKDEFASVRSFAFVDGISEVTGILASSRDVTEATRAINEAASGVWLDGRSDYGHALEAFADAYGPQLGSRATLLVLGDARTNYHEPRADALAALAARCAHVFWLNPEPRAAWDSGDSVMSRYAPYCERVVECRSVRQLRTFVEALD